MTKCHFRDGADYSAGSQSTKLHKEIRGKLVPQLRDTVDDIILNRDMDHPSQVVNEQAFRAVSPDPLARARVKSHF